MIEFIKKMMEWALEKEEEAAKQCHVSPEEVDEQIAKVQEKKEALQKKCQEELEELEKVIARLQKIKEESLKCAVQKDKKEQ